MWRIGCDVGEEGPVRFALLFDPFERLGEEDVRAVALRALEDAVMTDGGIEICVARSIRAGTRVILPDAAASVDEHFVETAMVGLVRFGIAEVPLAEDAG